MDIKEQEEAASVLLPNRILKKMRLNKNYANVYTPYHELEAYELSWSQRKQQRMERRR